MLLIFSEVCFGTFLCPTAAPWELNAVRLPAFGQGGIRPASSRCASYQIQPPKTLSSASARHILGSCIPFLRWSVGVLHSVGGTFCVEAGKSLLCSNSDSWVLCL